MFPSPSKEGRPAQIVAISPKHVRENNRSTYLPYFKRFPNHKFHSQERSRPSQDPVKNERARRFFTEEHESNAPSDSAFAKAFSSATIKQKSSSQIRPRLIRQIYQRELHKHKRVSEQSLDHGLRIGVNTRINAHAGPASPLLILRGHHNLTDFEMEEILNFNEIYYFGQNCVKTDISISDQKGKDGSQDNYPWIKGDHIAYRYEFVEILGEGSFGQVFKCLDHKHNLQAVALKIVKNNEKYTAQAKIELKILNYIKVKDPGSSKNCIEIKEYFSFRNRICMTFPLMSMNLYELIKSNGYYGLPLDLIRRFVLQILNAVHFLHKNKIIHADLKPENILLKEPKKSGVKIIDFGSSCFDGETIYTYIQSRYYRGPEVILGLPYDRKIDIWSFGCIIAELHLGYPLFGGEDQHEQLCLIVEVLGLPPVELIQNSKRWHVFFDSNHSLKSHPKKTQPASKSLSKALEDADPDFVDFIRTCLEWCPQKRVEALDLLKHPWVLDNLPQDFKEQHLRFIHQQERLGIQNFDISRNPSSVRPIRKNTFSIRGKHRILK